MTQLLRVQNFMVSSDGFGSGEGQSLERPFGHANPAELASWAGAYERLVAESYPLMPAMHRATRLVWDNFKKASGLLR